MAKSRTLCWNICSSSESMVSGWTAGISVAVVILARILSRAHGGDEVAEIGVFGWDADGVGEVVVRLFRIDALRLGGIVRGVGAASHLCLDQREVDARLDRVGGDARGLAHRGQRLVVAAGPAQHRAEVHPRVVALRIETDGLAVGALRVGEVVFCRVRAAEGVPGVRGRRGLKILLELRDGLVGAAEGELRLPAELLDGGAAGGRLLER